MSTVTNELFECVWPFCGVGAQRVNLLKNNYWINLLSKSVKWNTKLILFSLENLHHTIVSSSCFMFQSIIFSLTGSLIDDTSNKPLYLLIRPTNHNIGWFWLIHSHKKRKDTLETWAIYIEIYGIFKFTQQPKTQGINFKNMASSKGNLLLAGASHAIIDKIQADMFQIAIKWNWKWIFID